MERIRLELNKWCGPIEFNNFCFIFHARPNNIISWKLGLRILLYSLCGFFLFMRICQRIIFQWVSCFITKNSHIFGYYYEKACRIRNWTQKKTMKNDATDILPEQIKFRIYCNTFYGLSFLCCSCPCPCPCPMLTPWTNEMDRWSPMDKFILWTAYKARTHNSWPLFVYNSLCKFVVRLNPTASLYNLATAATMKWIHSMYISSD